MENKSFVSPGTAGLAQRISLTNEEKIELSVLQSNILEACTQNQY